MHQLKCLRGRVEVQLKEEEEGSLPREEREEVGMHVPVLVI